jgi:acetylornithine deacetylase/succinyl-diaminopimelate desuccinylase-like protein
MVFRPVCPIAMLFVRCGAGGISHHPDETMTAEDAEVATSVFLDFLETWTPPECR